MVVKSATIQQHATDLAESFFSIPKVQHETQSRKMCFWSWGRKALGLHAHSLGIEAKSNKC